MKLEVEMLAADGGNGEMRSFPATDYTLDEFGTLRIYEKREDVASGVPLFMVPRGGWRTVTRCTPIVGAQTATDHRPASGQGAPPRILVGASMISDPRLIADMDADMDAENQRLSREWEAKVRAVESAKVPEGIVSGHKATRGIAPAACSGRVAIGLCVAEFTVTRGEARHHFCAEHLPEGLRGFLTAWWWEGITDHSIVVTTVPR